MSFANGWTSVSITIFPKDISSYFLEEPGKHVQDKECISKDFLNAEADEFEAKGRPINY